MTGKNRNIYWDSCIFIAWITDEQRPNNEMLGVRDTLGQVAAKKVRIITSVIAETEIFMDSLSLEKYQKILRVLRNPAYCNLVNVDTNIARLARELRERIKK